MNSAKKGNQVVLAKGTKIDVLHQHQVLTLFVKYSPIRHFCMAERGGISGGEGGRGRRMGGWVGGEARREGKGGRVGG